ncbi:hypothetical protein SLS53_004173, partial [Cytospora paraplurivora]
VYVHVKSTIEHQTGIGPFTGWNDLAVEFIFSVPTTWRSLEIINAFKAAVRAAGFGSEGPRHSATVELTESEAAAVATIKSTAVRFERDDIFLSVDAGGGTTDFALMQVVEAREPFPALRQLTQVDGVGIGSTLIDRAFLELVEDRIFPFAELHAQEDREQLDFARVKAFGNPQVGQLWRDVQDDVQPGIHFQEELEKDPLDGQMYAMSQIDWLIKKGDDIDPNVPIISTFSQKIDKGSTIRHWDSVVVISHSERDFLPVSMKDSGAKQLCTVRSDLSGVKDSELELKKRSRRGFLSRSQKWLNCSYEVRALVGPADLNFELWFNGQRFSKNHTPIKVTWDQEGAALGQAPATATPPLPPPQVVLFPPSAAGRWGKARCSWPTRGA